MTIMLIIGLVLAGAAVSLLGRAAGVSRVRMGARLQEIEAYGYPVPAEAVAARGTPNLESLADRVGARAILRIPTLRPPDLDRLLARAGLYTMSPERFVGYRALATVSGVALGLWIVATGVFSPLLTVMAAVIVPLAAWQLPVVRLRTRGDRRVEQIDYDLPELIDVLIVTVEAGLGFNSSLQLAAGRMRGPLAEELGLALQEQRMGLSTHQALMNMLERCDTPSIRSFVRSVLQGELLGVSIGDIMRSLATETRKRRRQIAEERAQKAPIKILFPLIFLMFPALFVTLLYPAVSSILEVLGNT